MYDQTVIYYKVIILAAFPAITAIKATTANTAITANTATTATKVTTAIKAITATTATTATTVTTTTIATTATTVTGLPTDPSTDVTSVTAPFAAVPISLRKPLKNRPTDGMIWYLRCSHLGKEALESMVKRAIGDEIEAFTILQYSDCV